MKTSMKLGSQYGWGEQLNCRMFITLFSYFNTAAWMNITLMYASPNGRFSGQYLIVVHVEIVGGREDGYETWEASGLAFAVHPVPAWYNPVTLV